MANIQNMTNGTKRGNPYIDQATEQSDQMSTSAGGLSSAQKSNRKQTKGKKQLSERSRKSDGGSVK